MEEQKLTAQMLRDMILQVLEDMGQIMPYPLAAEPPRDNPTQDPPEDIILGENKRDVSDVTKAIILIQNMNDEERLRVFERFNVQTYDQFLRAVGKYERAKKAK